MPTTFTHAVIGGLAGRVFEGKEKPLRIWWLAMVISVLPDADVIGFSLGIKYGDFLGHRGFFHSPFFGVVMGLLGVVILWVSNRRLSRKWWVYGVLFALVGASHGVLDAFTDGGLGVALLAPWKNGRYFWPWRPIPVAPIGFEPLLMGYTIRVIMLEMVYIWLPVLVAGAGVVVVRRGYGRRRMRREKDFESEI